MDDEDCETWWTPRRAKHVPNLRNRLIVPPYVCEDSFRLPSLAEIRPGNTVQLKTGTAGDDGQICRDFLKIKNIIKNIATDTLILRGLRLRPNSCAKGILPLHLNEVYIVAEIAYDDNLPVLEQALVDIPIENVLKKTELTLTNVEYPKIAPQQPRSYSQDNRKLTCRWTHLICYKDSAAKDKGDTRRKHCETWIRLAKVDCDEGVGVSEVELKRQFRTEASLSSSD